MKKFLLLAGFSESIIQFRGPLLDDLLERGLDVHVAAPCLSFHTDVRAKLEGKGIKVHEITLNRAGMNPLLDTWTLIQLYRLMKRIRPDWVLSYTAKPVIYGLLAANAAGIAHRYALITGLGYAFTEVERTSFLQSGVRRIMERLYRLALARAATVFFQNPDDEDLFRSRHIIAEAVPSKILNGSGVPIDIFSQESVPNEHRFLMISRLIGAKGVRDYVNAARIVRARHPDTRFALAGWIDDNPDAISPEELKSWLEEGLIEYLGRLEDVRPALAACSAFVLPSFYREGTPRTILEAMAVGRAIITTDSPGCRETVISGKNGFLVPVRSSSILADAMLRFIEEPGLSERMGECSRQIACDKYDVRTVNKEIMREMGII